MTGTPMHAVSIMGGGNCPKCGAWIKAGDRLVCHPTGEWSHVQCPPKPKRDRQANEEGDR